MNGLADDVLMAVPMAFCQTSVEQRTALYQSRLWPSTTNECKFTKKMQYFIIFQDKIFLNLGHNTPSSFDKSVFEGSFMGNHHFFSVFKDFLCLKKGNFCFFCYFCTNL